MEPYDSKQSYMGPGPATVPRSWVSEAENRAAYAHDSAYNALGPRAYFEFVDADRKFIYDLERAKSRTVAGKIAQHVFEVKRLFAPHSKTSSMPKRSTGTLDAPWHRSDGRRLKRRRVPTRYLLKSLPHRTRNFGARRRVYRRYRMAYPRLKYRV